MAAGLAEDVRRWRDTATDPVAVPWPASVAARRYPGTLSDADHAHLRLVAELLRLRADPSDAAPVLERLEARHAAIGAASRKWHLVDEGRALCLDNYRTRPDACWRVPLPSYLQASRQSAAGAGASRGLRRM